MTQADGVEKDKESPRNTKVVPCPMGLGLREKVRTGGMSTDAAIFELRALHAPAGVVAWFESHRNVDWKKARAKK
jgi:hypothetical protein